MEVPLRHTLFDAQGLCHGPTLSNKCLRKGNNCGMTQTRTQGLSLSMRQLSGWVTWLTFDIFLLLNEILYHGRSIETCQYLMLGAPALDPHLSTKCRRRGKKCGQTVTWTQDLWLPVRQLNCWATIPDLWHFPPCLIRFVHKSTQKHGGTNMTCRILCLWL